MENRPFGRTGLRVSAIGFGCWEIGGGYGRIEETEFEEPREPRDRFLTTRRQEYDVSVACGGSSPPFPEHDGICVRRGGHAYHEVFLWRDPD